jgi:predicted nucleotidyltransferase
MSSLRAGDDPILKRLRAALDEVYGARAERVVLFGSRARGDAREDSDYDVAVFIENPDSQGEELDRHDGHFAGHRRGDFREALSRRHLS